MFNYKILNENQFQVTGENYKAIFNGDETKAKEVVQQLTKSIIDGRKNKLKSKMKSIVDEKISLFNSQYPKEEQKIFSTLIEEYRSYIKDNIVPTPTIDEFASTEGISKEELIQKIAKKYKLVINIIALRHKFKNQLNNITNLNDLENIENIIQQLSSINTIEEFNKFIQKLE